MPLPLSSSFSRALPLLALATSLTACPGSNVAMSEAYCGVDLGTPTALGDDDMIEAWGASLAGTPVFASSPHTIDFVIANTDAVVATTVSLSFANAMFAPYEGKKADCVDKVTADLTLTIQSEDLALDEVLTATAAEFNEGNGFDFEAPAFSGTWADDRTGDDAGTIEGVSASAIFDATSALPEVILSVTLPDTSRLVAQTE